MSVLDQIQKIKEEENLPVIERVKKIREESFIEKAGKFAKDVGFVAITENPVLKSLRQAPPEKLSKFMNENSLEDIVDYSIRTAKEGAAKWADYTKEKNANIISRFFSRALADVLPQNLTEFTENAAIGGMMGQEILPIAEGLSKKLPRVLDKVSPQKTEKVAKQFLTQELKRFAKTEQGAKRIEESLNFLETIQKKSRKTNGLFDEAIEKFNKIPDQKYAGSINLERQRISNIAKQMEIETFEKLGVKKTVSNEETIKEAQKIFQKFQDDPKYFAERVDLIKQGKTPTTAEELAHRIVNATNQENFIEAARKTARGEMPVEDFRRLEDTVKDQQLNVADPLASEAGRRLQMYNIEVGKNRAFKAMAKLKNGMNDRQLAEFNHLAETGFDPKAVDDFVERLPNPKLKEYLYEIWYNSILSGVPTHIVNVASNTLWALWQLPHKTLTAGVDNMLAKFKGRPQQVFMREIVPQLAGIKKGFVEGAKGAMEVVKTGRAEKFNSKFDRELGTKIMSAFERSPNKILHKFAPIVSSPSRALQAMDVWANAISYESNLRAIAKRKALQQADGKMGKMLESALFKNPTEEMRNEAVKLARYATFQDDPGKITQLILKARNTIPGARLVVPFVNTVANLTKRGIEMTPGLGLTLARGQRPAEITAKQIEGAVLTFLLANKVANGEVIGAAPENKNEREAFYRQGKIPWSIRMGGEKMPDGTTQEGKYISFRRIEPFNTVLASISEFYRNFAKSPDDKSNTEKFLAATQGVVENLIDSSYLQGVQDLVKEHQEWEDVGKRKLTSFIPWSGFWRSINAAWEAAEEGEAKVRESKDWLGAFSQVIPGLYKYKEPRLDVWGEDIVKEGNFFRQWLPFKWSTGTSDPVEIELERLGYYPGLPSQTITNLKGEKVKLSDDDYRDYVKTVGRQGKQTLTEIISRPQYQKQDEDIRLKILDKELSKIRRNWLKKVKGIATRDDQ